MRGHVLLRTTAASASVANRCQSLPIAARGDGLWHQASVHAVVSASDVASWSALGLAADLEGRVSNAHYTVEIRAAVRERGQRIRGLGSFADAQQLDLAGVR
jgi:hypothetical protein